MLVFVDSDVVVMDFPATTADACEDMVACWWLRGCSG
jgi:hypothetical protein